MNLETLITTYGYPALALGCLLEGGTVVFVSGALAHRGYLQLPWVIVITFLCAFGADEFFFQVGKRKGGGVLDRWPRLRSRSEKVRNFLVRHQVPTILGFRFIYGMRTITPILIGASNISTGRFVSLNLCSTLLWSSMVASLGYFSGHLVDRIIAEVRDYRVAISMIVIGFATSFLIYRWRMKRVLDTEDE